MASKVTTKDEAAALLQRERYSERIIPVLEEYVDLQVKSQQYDLDANLGLLKLYQFYPQHWNKDYATKVLAKALMQLPATDYSMMAFLLTETASHDPAVQMLAEMAELLEKTSFSKFWEVYESPAAVAIKGIPGFAEAIQNYVVYVVGMTFQKIDKQVLSKFLHVPSTGVAAVIAKHGWAEEGTQIKIALNADNQARPKKMADHVRFTQLPKLLATLGAE